MSNDARILVATDEVGDAEMLKGVLRQEFKNVSVSTDPDQAVADFEQNKPLVLILAFNGLEKAERYYLGLYRLSSLVHTLPHRTVILCNKDNVDQVYRLCRDGYFDDYILFWPLTYDTPRLLMAVHCALRDLAVADAGRPMATEMAAQARHIAELEAVLERSLAQGDARTAAVSQSMERAEAEIGTAIDGFSNDLIQGKLAYAGGGKNASKLQREIKKLKEEGVLQHFRAMNDAMQPVRQWVGGLKQEVAPHMDSVRTLKAMADRIPPLVLVVDDDGFQCKLLAQVLGQEGLDVMFASSGVKALTALHKRRPDLILMDVALPDLSGIEVTRRLKSVKAFAEIPVVMITGQSEKDVVADSIRAGAVDFIVKPFHVESLLKKVSRFLKRANTQDPDQNCP